MGLNKLLSYAGRLILVNSVLSSLPTFYLCTLKLPVGVIQQIDCYRKHYLWDKGDINRKGGCLVAWKDARRSKEQGELGIIDLKTQNTSLLTKSLHKFYNHEIIPWVSLTWRCLYSNDVVPHMKRPVGSFWWRDVMTLSDSFLRIASCKVNKGNSVCFWTDLWDLGALNLVFPQLFSFVRIRMPQLRNSCHRMLIQISSHQCPQWLVINWLNLFSSFKGYQ